MMLFDNKKIHTASSVIILIIISPITYYLLTRKVVAPFGKHTSSKQNSQYNWGPSINPKLAWFLFESPNLVWCIFAYFHRNKNVFDEHYANIILFGVFVIHYVNRCILYPLQMKRGSSTVNLAIFSSAFFFCCINGFLQAQNYCQFQVYPDNYHTQIHFIAGICIWFVGFIMNIQSDSILRNLRNNDNDSSGSNTSSGNKTKDTQPTSITPAQRYKIPHGGFFQYVSCANFFGEIIEWLGYAIASSSIAAWGFWAFVCANLIPRGMAHHKWYLDKFKEDYPKDRSAVIPFIL